MDNAQKIWDKLLAAGLTPAGAAGLLGNLYAESGLRPDNLQDGFERKLGMSDADYTAAVDSGAYTGFVTDGAGYGLAQWTYPSRKAALLAYAKARGRSIGDLDTQAGYLLQELQSLFPAVLGVLRTTRSVREASDCVLLQYERPADQSAANCARRAGFGQEFYEEARRSGQRGSLERSEAERRPAQRAADQAETERKRPSALAASQRDNNRFTGGNKMDCLMTAEEFCAQLLDIAERKKTAYMLGPWGWPANDRMIKRATTQGSNAQNNRQWLAKANAIKDRGFLFDCVGLIKGILWGWNGDLSRTYGGAGYACNGVPDCDAKKMIGLCREVSTDFPNIVPGEAVWMDGHIGVYVGGGMAVEATPKWKGGVQLSTCANVSPGLIFGTAGSRRWTKHGKLPWVDYAAQENEIEEDDEMTYYKTINDVPEWYRPAVDKAVKAGALNGDGDGLNVSEDLCRTLTVLDRLGKLD